MECQIKELKSKLEIERKQHEGEMMQTVVDNQSKNRDLELKLMKLQKEREVFEQDNNTESLHQERDSLLRKVSDLAMQLSNLKANENDVNILRNNCMQLDKELQNERFEIEKLAHKLSEKNIIIKKLKDDNKRKTLELETIDEENSLRVVFINR